MSSTTCQTVPKQAICGDHMALIVITIQDNDAGDADVGVLMEPPINFANPGTELSGAQQAALNMLNAVIKEQPVKEDRGLIQLIN